MHLWGLTSANSVLLGLGGLFSKSYVKFFSQILISSPVHLTNLTDYSHNEFIDHFAKCIQSTCIAVSSLIVLIHE